MTNRFTWIGEIDDEFLQEMFKQLPRRCDEGEPDHRLNLTSPGGSLYHALAAVDYFESLSGHLHVHATGLCMSSAVLLLALGDTRSATIRTRFMVHGGNLFLPESATSKWLHRETAELDHLEELYIKLLAQRTKKKRAWWEAKIKGEHTSWYFGVDEALSIGLIDEIH